jgi:hypothetical protein
MQKFFCVIICTLFLAACNKSEIDLISPNQPPPDNSIAAVSIENYITRAYILALGREPDSSEFLHANNLLSAGSMDSTSRRIFVDSIFTDHDYLPNLYNQNRINLLNNVDTADFTMWISLFQLFLSDTSYQIQWPFFQYEADRMIDLRNAYSEFVSGTIRIDELQRRMCNNYLYDQINMGSANFVISTFQNLINRNPTNSEQQSGISMVDGNNSVLFLQSGNSKDDYLDIFTHSNSYYEGQVILLYIKYLQRTATSVEMSEGTAKYAATGDYTIVQKDILTTDEFAGL